MPTLTDEAWAQIRADYEHTKRPIEDICGAHGISSGTLRDRVRRWEWTRRRQPIPVHGPPPIPAPPLQPVTVRAIAPPAAGQATSALAIEPEITDAAARVAPPVAANSAAPIEAAAAPLDASNTAIARRLQGAVARVLPAIETTLATLGAGTTHPREMEQAGRALGALTRTLRELNALLVQHPVPDDDPKTLDEYRRDLMRKMDQIIAERPTREESA